MTLNEQGASAFTKVNKVNQAYCIFSTCKKSKNEKNTQKTVKKKNAGIKPLSYEFKESFTEISDDIKKSSILQVDQIKNNMNGDVPELQYKNARTQSPKGKTLKKSLKENKNNTMIGDTAYSEGKSIKKVSFKDTDLNINNNVHEIISGKNTLHRKKLKSYEVNPPPKKSKSPKIYKDKVHKKSSEVNINNKTEEKGNLKIEVKAKGNCGGGPCISGNEICSNYNKCLCDKGTTKTKLQNCDKENVKVLKEKNLCKDGICNDALKNKDYKFLCNCKKIKEARVPIECNENTCTVNQADLIDSTGVMNFKKRITCLCRKYSQKIKQNHNRDICARGICETSHSQGVDFICNCPQKPKIRECSEENCNKLTNVKYQNKINSSVKPEFKTENDQTGEPFFDVKLNTIDMCVLNPSDIMDKVTTLGKIKRKQGPCVCPSHINLMTKYNKEDNSLCEDGTCARIKKNKKTNFTCKCLKRRILRCGDDTCKSNKIYNTKHHLQTDSMPMHDENPLFDMKVDSDNMCIINPKDVRRKIKLFEMARAQGDHCCSTGICRENKNRKDVKMSCHCKRKHEPLECTNVTCGPPKPPIDPYISKSNESFFYWLCKRCISKSVNLNRSNQRRKKRRPRQLNTHSAAKWCRGLLCTQSDNIKTKDGLKISINQKHLPTCDCSECKSKENTSRSKWKTKENKKHTVKHTKVNIQPINNNTPKGDTQKEANIKSIKTSIERKYFKRNKSCGDANCNRYNTNVSGLNACSCCTCTSSTRNMQKCKTFITSSFAKLRKRCVYKINKREQSKPQTPTKDKAEVKAKKQYPKKEAEKPLNSRIKKQNIKKVSNEIKNQNDNNCNCCICGKTKSNCTCKQSSKIKVCGRNICQSITVFRTKIHRPRVSISKKEKPTKVVANKALPKKNLENVSSTCFCDHECQCSLLKEKSKIANAKAKQLNSRSKSLQKKKKANQKKRKRSLSNKKLQESLASDKKYSKQVERQERAEKKKQMKFEKQQLKELEAQWKGKEEMQETSCCADFFLGFFKFSFSVVKMLVFVLFKTITQPRISFHYVKMRVQDPVGTYERIKKWLSEKWHIKKMQMAKTMGGSETMTVLTDTLKDTAIYEAFANKGQTKKERNAYELERKRRKIRIRNRNNTALYSCRHMLLTTLRKTPCLWVYHLCPAFYPQCLSLLAFLKNFSHMMLFLLAFICWTPCIATFELCRAFLCCFMCTG